MKRTLPILFILVLCSCIPVSPIPTPTSLSFISQATNNGVIASEVPTPFYPHCVLSETDQLPTSTPPIPESPPQKLTNGLTIKEYRSYVYDLHIQDSGCEYADRNLADITINLNSSYQVIIQPIDMNSELVKVFKGGR